MAVSYNKLWKKLSDLDMSRTQLRLKAGISTKTLAKLGKNENVNTDVLVKVCQALDCNVDEIMDITDPEETNEKFEEIAGRRQKAEQENAEQ